MRPEGWQSTITACDEETGSRGAPATGACYPYLVGPSRIRHAALRRRRMPFDGSLCRRLEAAARGGRGIRLIPNSLSLSPLDSVNMRPPYAHPYHAEPCRAIRAMRAYDRWRNLDRRPDRARTQQKTSLARSALITARPLAELGRPRRLNVNIATSPPLDQLYSVTVTVTLPYHRIVTFASHRPFPCT